MTRASIKTLLPLDTWADILGIDPRHFSQVITAAKPATLCSNVWKQYAWQEAQQIGREDIARAIAEAERAMIDYLDYNLVPDWIVDERVRVTQPGIPDVLNVGGRDSRGFHMSAKMRRAHLVSGGIEGKTIVDLQAVVKYTDVDGDDYPETATITAAIPASVPLTDTDEVAVYVPGEGGRDEWEIRPLNDPLTRRRSVSIAAGVATIVCAREQLVDPDLISALDPGPVEGDIGEDANFLATVNVYRHFNDPQQQVTLMWAPRPDWCDCGTTTCTTCAHATQTGCLVAQDYRQGSFFFRPATWDSDDEEFDSTEFAVARNPENLRVWYYAGFRDQSRDAPAIEMDRNLARAVAYLSLTYLTRGLCGCNNVDAIAKRMQEDLAVTTDAFSRQVQDRILTNPFGTQRGALYAWNVVQSGDRPIGRAVAL